MANNVDKLQTAFEASERGIGRSGSGGGGYDIDASSLKPGRGKSAPSNYEQKQFAGRSALTWEPEDMGYEFHEEGMKREKPSASVKRK